jgi:lipopolysaccharide export system permease protein
LGNDKGVGTMILHLYFARRFSTAFLFVTAAFSVLIVLLDFIDQLRRFRGNDVPFGNILHLVTLNVPATLYQMLPLIMVLCSIMLFLSLARSSELIIARAAGRSAVRSLIGPLLTALAIGIFAVLVLNPIVAATQKQYEILFSSFSSKRVSPVSLSASGLWLRQGDGEAQTVIHAQRANLDGTQLFDVALYEFNLSGKAMRRVSAETATLRDGYWDLLNVKEWQLQLGGNPEADANQMNKYKISTELTKEYIHDSFGTPASIPIWQLPMFIKQLEKAGFSARRHIVWFHMELALPLFLVAIVMVGAGFTMRQERQNRTSLMVLIAILFGFGLYFLRNFAQILGENGQLPEIWAAWIPPIAAISLSLAFLLHTEDG